MVSKVLVGLFEEDVSAGCGLLQRPVLPLAVFPLGNWGYNGGLQLGNDFERPSGNGSILTLRGTMSWRMDSSQRVGGRQASQP